MTQTATLSPLDTLMTLATRRDGVTVREFAKERGKTTRTGPYVRTVKKALKAKLLRTNGLRNGEEVYVTDQAKTPTTDSAPAAAPLAAEPLAPKKRGRPRKNAVALTVEAPQPHSEPRRSLIQEALEGRRQAQPVSVQPSSKAIIATMLRAIADAVELG